MQHNFNIYFAEKIIKLAMQCQKKYFLLINVMKVLVSPGEISRIDSWPHGIKLARWKDHDISSNDNYNYDWTNIFRGLHLDPGKGRKVFKVF